MNRAQILRIIAVCLAIVMLCFFFMTLYHLTSADEEDQIPILLIGESFVLCLLLFSGLSFKNRDYAMYQKIIKKGGGASLEFLKEFIGEDVVITTFTGELRGTIVEIDGQWLKIKDHDMRPMEHIVKSTMALSISIEEK